MQVRLQVRSMQTSAKRANNQFSKLRPESRTFQHIVLAARQADEFWGDTGRTGGQLKMIRFEPRRCGLNVTVIGLAEGLSALLHETIAVAIEACNACESRPWPSSECALYPKWRHYPRSCYKGAVPSVDLQSQMTCKTIRAKGHY